MEFLVNELSLHGQYTDERDFIPSLKLLFSCGQEIEKHDYSCYYNRQLTERKVTSVLTLRQALQRTGDRNFIQQVLTVLSKRGPFWLDSKRHSPDEYFEYQGDVVTDTALAETAWRVVMIHQQNCHTISFKPSRFNNSPLSVIWYQSEGEKIVDVQNFWEISSLAGFLRHYISPPTTWGELVQQSIKECRYLTISTNLSDKLNSEPFSKTIAKRIKELLLILNELNSCFESDGKLNSRGGEIIRNHFHGDKALFTDESKDNKNCFKNELTFKKPDHEEESIFCPFHGKINMGRQYRIHFNWPKEKPTDPLYIVYIGPKITKR